MDTTTPATPTSETQAPQKPALTLTAAALAQLKEVIEQQQLADHVVVIRVTPAGCSGLGYELNLMKAAKPDDITWTQDGVPLATDGISAGYLSGTVLDYVKGETAAGFKFDNPNAKASCGCGASFTA